MQDKTENQKTSDASNKFTVLDADGWNERWKNRNIGFHKDHINVMLEKHVNRLINNRENLKIFIPLCGKSLDMKWLADQGHTVVGVDCSEIAFQEFFEEHSLEHTVEPVETLSGKVYTSKDKNILLYCCDFYKFSRETAGQFNGIWDRGALVAINRHDRQKYSTLMKSLMAPDCQYLLDTLDYNEALWPGPPHFVSAEQIQSLYGDDCDIEDVDTMDAMEEKHKKRGLDYINERLHVITLKKQ
ncbi:probable thiopurine S-methyltransferase isoform X2 [Mytilus californianus]|uniref:probable thiopurine S-methyltransferase isoform X2 n=1 Tax=Mytilus californianus TaxID=6549 RepID=UPI002245966C|nr:probable thiopurine S-methyltransferase isoform X2 [Mytilus californianus]